MFDELLAGVRQNRSGVLVVRGEAGVGKTALLDYAVESAADLRVVRAGGVESEMELAFAAMHQLFAPLLDRLDRLPDPQRDALETVFGLNVGPPPDRFLVGLAVLTLVSDVAEDRPLVCVVDDAQWLDRASAQTLAFVARRLLAESVALVFATREPGQEFHGLPEVELRGLCNSDARELLGSVVRWPLDERVRDQIVAETRGNPLALLELPQGLSPAQLAGGFGLPSALPLSSRIEDSFRRRVDEVPQQTQQLLLLAAADPSGDPALLWRAAAQFGLGHEALLPAELVGLLEVGARLRFRHPLVRSAVYRAASPTARRQAHAALAQATDPDVDPDRRAWHRAQATLSPDEDVAAELEQSAGRAQGRGGLGAAAAFLERAAALTVDPARRAERLLAAVRINLRTGAFDAALGLLATAENGSLDELQRARAVLLRGQIAFVSGLGSDAPPLLLDAARRLEPLDPRLARETYLDAWGAALFAGHVAKSGNLLEVSRAARAAPPPSDPGRPVDLLLDGFAALVTDGRPTAAPMLRRAVRAFAGDETTVEEGLRWGWLAVAATSVLWDGETKHAIHARQVQRARDAGALGLLSIDLAAQAIGVAWSGDFGGADALIAEAAAVSEVTGTRHVPYADLMLASLRGREADAGPLIEATVTDAEATGQGMGVTWARWVAGILYNGLCRYDLALAAAQEASAAGAELFVANWALPELIEAAALSGQPAVAAVALERLTEIAEVSDTDWALGIAARSRALLSEGDIAEGLHRHAIERLGRTRLRPELARAHLLYGEWLRRQCRRLDARDQLRTAHGMFAAIGMEAFEQRAEHELLATGEHARKRTVATLDDLTTQELQVAQMARDGLSNPEIGARLFISPRTVKYHLQKVFIKLDITSRGQLDHALPTGADPHRPRRAQDAA